MDYFSTFSINAHLCVCVYVLYLSKAMYVCVCMCVYSQMSLSDKGMFWEMFH